MTRLRPARRRLRIATAACAIFLTLSPGQGPMAESQDTARDEALVLLQGKIRPNMHVLEVENLVEKIFAEQDVDGGGISDSDRTLAADRAAAVVRARLIGEWMRLDLDGDGTVTQEEARRELSAQARGPMRPAWAPLYFRTTPSEAQVATMVDLLLAQANLPDPDGDGVTTLAEMIAGAEAQIAAEPKQASPRIRTPISPGFDADGDGTVSRSEVLGAVAALLGEFDANGDRRFSREEVWAFDQAIGGARRRLSVAQRAAKAGRSGAACHLPAPPARAELVAVAVGEGLALSSVHLGDGDTVTTVGDLRIAKGTRPIHLVVHSDAPMILRFSGKTERLARVVALGGPKGFVGVPRDRVLWVDRASCPVTRLTLTGDSGKAASSFFAEAARRRPDRLAAIPKLGMLTVPDSRHEPRHGFPGAIAPDLTGPAGSMWKRFLAFRPGGLVYLSQADIVAPAPVARYELLPQEAGLATLIERGALTVIDPGRYDETLPRSPDGGVMWNGVRIVGGSSNSILADDTRVFVKDDLGVWTGGRMPVLEARAQVRLPAGLFGVHRVTLRLPPGVPAPDGPLGEVRIERLSE